jgi:hypothetical protein
MIERRHEEKHPAWRLRKDVGSQFGHGFGGGVHNGNADQNGKMTLATWSRWPSGRGKHYGAGDIFGRGQGQG